MESGSSIPAEAMFLSGLRTEIGLEFADEDAVAALVGISAAGMESNFCSTEFPLSSVVCGGFPWLLSSLSAQHTGVASHGSVMFPIIEHRALTTCILLKIWQRPPADLPVKTARCINSDGAEKLLSLNSFFLSHPMILPGYSRDAEHHISSPLFSIPCIFALYLSIILFKTFSC